MGSDVLTGPPRAERARDAATLTIVLAGAALLPLIVVPGASDSFRLPKELFVRAEAILIVAATLIAWIFGTPLPRFSWRDRSMAVPLAAIVVFALLTALSNRPMISASALATAVATFIIFWATVAVAKTRRWLLVAVPLGSAAANAILVVLEETRIWMPFGEQPGITHHLQCAALIGNPNEVGSYLGAALIGGLALMVARRGRRTMPAIGVAILLAGLVASRTLTAAVAFGAGAMLMLALGSWRTALRAALAGLVAALLLAALVAPLRQRAANMMLWVRSGDYNALLTERLTPFISAYGMFKDHPLTGVGPGAFAWHYYDYKLRAEMRITGLRAAYNRGTHYGQVHDDHLQVLAEGGLIGYAAFLASLVALASLSFATRNVFVRRMAAPLALYWIVLSFAQFPLETAVVRALLIHFAALAVAWRDD